MNLTKNYRNIKITDNLKEIRKRIAKMEAIANIMYQKGDILQLEEIIKLADMGADLSKESTDNLKIMKKKVNVLLKEN